MKTIEELGKLAQETCLAYWRRHGLPGGNEKDAFIAVVKAVITADLTRTGCCGRALCEGCTARHGTCATKENR